MSEPVIKCENVYKIFGANAQKMLQDSNGNVDAKTFQENGCIVGVNNASFEVSKGEMLVVMGLSGSGKSTLLRCISRLTDATGGKIFIEGQDLLQLNNKDLIDLRRNKMGMVFQSFALLPHKTVVENIAFPLQIKGIKTEDSINKAMDMVKLVGLVGSEMCIRDRSIRSLLFSCKRSRPSIKILPPVASVNLDIHLNKAVSYTHLTLPTSRSV